MAKRASPLTDTRIIYWGDNIVQLTSLRYPVQVTQKDKAGLPDIMSFEAMMAKLDRKIGFLSRPTTRR